MFKKLINWSLDQHHHLPWRENRSLYKTLVSEIMLQQTTVSTVMNHYERFLNLYPTSEALALATEEEVCMAWKGLGYYRRARNLRKAAMDIELIFDGEIPLDHEELVSISGIGEYTANAILAIGADQKALAIDANLERVLSRIYLVEEEKGPKLQKKIKAHFDDGKIVKEINKFGARNLNEALMDLGRVFCQARKANCAECPMKSKCLAFKADRALEFPQVKTEKTKKKMYDLDLLRVIVKKKDKVLAYTKTNKEWLSGQLEIPTLILKSEDKKLKQYPMASAEIELKGLKKFKTSITKYKINNYILELNESDFNKQFGTKAKYDFVPFDIEKENFSTSTLKVFERI
jgi:A/G-specific adenine glycosylase